MQWVQLRGGRRACRCTLAAVSAIAFSQSSDVQADDYFVNPTGSDSAYRTVQAAVDAVVGQTETNRANIFLAPAKYVEQVAVLKPFVTFIGQGTTSADVTISFNSPHTGEDWNAATTIGRGATAFMARNVTFENSTADTMHVPALAIQSNADRAVFDNVRFLGHQDTLLVDDRTRQYFRNNFITGDVDFIFGAATAVFDQCTIESTDDGYITASDTARITANGLIFVDCTLVAGMSVPNNSVFLGRPWLWDEPHQMPGVIYIRTRMGPHIARTGWDPWNSILDPSLDRDPRTRVSEWSSMDLDGALLQDSNEDGTPDGRVLWADAMTTAHEGNYTLRNIFGPVEFWDAMTQPDTPGIPYVSQGDPWNPQAQLLALPARPAAQPQLFNASTRLRVGSNDSAGIGGFIVTGKAPKKVIVRALGASLNAAGLDNVLADPVLELHRADGSLMATNDNWQDDAASASQLATLGLAPPNVLEAAIVLTLSPGSYTAVVRGNRAATGTALIELYDGGLAVDSQLANISTRGFVGTDGDVMIGGFIVGNNGRGTGRVVIRALGPSLSTYGITTALEDPFLELRDDDGTILISNDDWPQTQETDIAQTGLAPTDFREAALVTTLPNGNYTAIARGKDGATGLAIVEIYNLL